MAFDGNGAGYIGECDSECRPSGWGVYADGVILCEGRFEAGRLVGPGLIVIFRSTVISDLSEIFITDNINHRLLKHNSTNSTSSSSCCCSTVPYIPNHNKALQAGLARFKATNKTNLGSSFAATLCSANLIHSGLGYADHPTVPYFTFPASPTEPTDWFNVPFDELVFLKPLGSNTVWAGEWLSTKVAIRVVNCRNRAKWNALVDVLRTLRHPSLSLVLGVSAVPQTLRQGTYCIVNEWVEGDNLNCWIKRKSENGSYSIAQPPDLTAVLNVFRGIASACDYLKSKGCVHGCLRPENVLLTPAFEVKLTGYGLGLLEEDRALEKGALVDLSATLLVASPRQQPSLSLMLTTEELPESVSTPPLRSGAGLSSLRRIFNFTASDDIEGEELEETTTTTTEVSWIQSYHTNCLSRWRAPETINLGHTYGQTEASDVYCIGLLFWAVLASREPLDDLSDAQYELLIGRGKFRLPRLIGLPIEIENVLSKCLEPMRPVERETTGQLVKEFGDLIQRLPIIVEKLIEQMLTWP